jgi:hypothetical protein
MRESGAFRFAGKEIEMLNRSLMYNFPDEARRMGLIGPGPRSPEHPCHEEIDLHRSCILTRLLVSQDKRPEKSLPPPVCCHIE